MVNTPSKKRTFPQKRRVKVFLRRRDFLSREIDKNSFTESECNYSQVSRIKTHLAQRGERKHKKKFRHEFCQGKTQRLRTLTGALKIPFPHKNTQFSSPCYEEVRLIGGKEWLNEV